jgi:hypothetical protein
MSMSRLAFLLIFLIKLSLENRVAVCMQMSSRMIGVDTAFIGQYTGSHLLVLAIDRSREQHT